MRKIIGGGRRARLLRTTSVREVLESSLKGTAHAKGCSRSSQLCIYDDLVDLFGRQGVEVSSVHLPNSGTTTEVHEWHNSDGATVVVTFQNGRMTRSEEHTSEL